MNTELLCLTCSVPLAGKRTKFCCRKHAMKWHNSRLPWLERKDHHRKNALKRSLYKADPEYWKNKQRQWHKDHPEQSKLIEHRTREKYWLTPWRNLIRGAKSRSKRRNIPFDLTFEWAEKRWTGFCELTQIPFVQRRGARNGVFSPSMDRIDPTKGYTQDNTRFILFGINALKFTGTDETMYLLAESLINQRDQKRAPLTP